MNHIEVALALSVLFPYAGDKSVFDAKLGAARCQAQVEGRDKALAALEELKKAYADESSVARIDATIDVVKRWEKREKIAPPAPMALAVPQDTAK